MKLAGTPLSAWWSDRRAGDMSGLGLPGAETLGDALGANAFGVPAEVPKQVPVLRVRQVHGGRVVEAGTWGDAGPADLPEADAVVARASNHKTPSRNLLAVMVADCAAIALGSQDGALGAVHAGWRSLRANVVEAAVSALRSRSDGELVAAIGPCIHSCCYEFSARDLEGLEKRFGPGVRGVTRSGRLALDLPRTVELALEQLGVQIVWTSASCTGCDARYFSWRSHADKARQALLVWHSDLAMQQ